MELVNKYNTKYREKTIEVHLCPSEVKLVLFALRRDPQKSDFSKRLINELDKYLKMADAFKFK